MSAWKPLPGELERVEAELQEAIQFAQSLIDEGMPKALDGHGLLSVASDTLDAVRRGEYHAALVLDVVKMRARIAGYPVTTNAHTAAFVKKQAAAERAGRLQGHADAIRAENPRWKKEAIAKAIVERGLDEGLASDTIRKLIK